MGTYSRRCFSSLNDFGWCLPEVDSLGRKKTSIITILRDGIDFRIKSIRRSYLYNLHNVGQVP